MAANFNLEEYITVNQRIELFYKDHPNGSIQSEIVSNVGGQMIMKAYVYREQDDKLPCTGHAMEQEGSSFINKGSHIENCETSAVGRALALMGYEVKKAVASREEVANARLNQEIQPNTPPKSKQETITESQAKRMFAIAGNPQIVQAMLIKEGYKNSTDVKKSEYERICKVLEKKGEAK